MHWFQNGDKVVIVKTPHILSGLFSVGLTKGSTGVVDDSACKILYPDEVPVLWNNRLGIAIHCSYIVKYEQIIGGSVVITASQKPRRPCPDCAHTSHPGKYLSIFPGSVPEDCGTCKGQTWVSS